MNVQRIMLYMGNVAATSCSVVLYVTFIFIFFFSPSGAYVDINYYGEATLELIVLLLLLPCIIYSFIHNLKQFNVK